MARHVTLDVREMPQPEAIARVVETICDFGEGDTLRLVIDWVPLPLYDILERNGYAHHEELGTESNYEITIWQKPDAGQ